MVASIVGVCSISQEYENLTIDMTGILNYMKYVIYISVGIAVVVVGVIALAGMYKFNYQASQPGYDADGNQILVTNYEECVAAGYPVMESFPEQCSDGQTTFVNEPLAPEVAITNYDECVAAGNPTTRSIPAQCSDGENVFVQALEPDLVASPDVLGDVDVIVGMTVAQAEAYAEATGVPFRVGFQDGEYFAVTMDYRPGRITASVEGGVVTDYSVE